MPEHGIEQKENYCSPANPRRKHSLSEREGDGEAQAACNQRDDKKRLLRIAEHNIEDPGEQHEKGISRRLRLMNTGIEGVEREGKIDVIDGQVLRRNRNPSNEQERADEYPE